MRKIYIVRCQWQNPLPRVTGPCSILYDLTFLFFFYFLTYYLSFSKVLVFNIKCNIRENPVNNFPQVCGRCVSMHVTLIYTRGIEQSNADINLSKLMFVVIWCTLFDSHAFIDRHKWHQYKSCLKSTFGVSNFHEFKGRFFVFCCFFCRFKI